MKIALGFAVFLAAGWWFAKVPVAAWLMKRRQRLTQIKPNLCK